MSRNFGFWAVIFLNVGIVGIEIFYGYISNSIALITDALHNFGDVVAVVISFIASIFARKSPTSKSSFGYLRAEMMATFVNSFMLILVMAFVLYEAIFSLFTPKEISGSIVIIVASVALFANGVSAYLLFKIREDKHDLNVHSAYLHFLADSLLSFSVVLGGFVIYFLQIYLIDSILSIIFSIYIIYASLPLLKKSFYSLMDIEHRVDIEKIEVAILEVENVKSLHDVHLLQPSLKHSFFYGHIVVEENLTLRDIDFLIGEVEAVLSKFEINHSVIQPESEKHLKAPLLKESYSETL
jgi:cobalt-zinc-cadmium efflux system protein